MNIEVKTDQHHVTKITVNERKLIHNFNPDNLQGWVKDIQKDDPREEEYYWFYSEACDTIRYTRDEYRQILVKGVEHHILLLENGV